MSNLQSRRRGHVPKVHVPDRRPTVHLICNAHLDPVWQWRWEEGAAEALATFGNAVEILDEDPDLIFCHNEAVLYQWAERYDPALFREIGRLVLAGRWAIAGGWFIQPDVNIPGTESLIRHIAEGRRYFSEKFGAAPRVAYNFDSFGHTAGLPQILRQAGYEMYIHMRPQEHELGLPADLYRWRGADGTEILAYRIAVGLYHTERDNIGERLSAGVELALRLGRDVPVFWGLGNHGGGATRRDLETIRAFAASEKRVRVIHSTPEVFFGAVRKAAEKAPLFEGDLQRCFTGCYTSLSRLKRRAARSLGGLVQSEAAAAAAWRLAAKPFPAAEFGEAWRLHLFNDFHDIITGSCVEPAEGDALDEYGRAEGIAREIKLGAAAALARLASAPRAPDVTGGRDPIPVVALNANPALTRVPVEFECMAGYRPFWKGEWRLRLFRADGLEVPCQEEQPEALLPFNDWRRRICFLDDLPGVGASFYYLLAFESEKREGGRRTFGPTLAHRLDPDTGFVTSVASAHGVECLAGPLLEPLVLADTADSWGTGCPSYRGEAGAFRRQGPPVRLCEGPVRTITQSVFSFGQSRIIQEVHAYAEWPVLDIRLRIIWNEERRRLKLRIPTRFRVPGLLCEVPGGAAERPADGEEHVHGRWLVAAGVLDGRRAALGVAASGLHGLDFKDGEIRLSVLRSAAYCHERGFEIGESPARKFTDLGVHDVRVLVTAGEPRRVTAAMTGLADFCDAPPAVYSHLPWGAWGSRDRQARSPLSGVSKGSGLASRGPSRGRPGAAGESASGSGRAVGLLDLSPANVRLLALKPSWDGAALVVRLQESAGVRTKAGLIVSPGAAPPGAPVFSKKAKKGTGKSHVSPISAAARPVRLDLEFRPFEIKTLRIEPPGSWREVALIDEV